MIFYIIVHRGHNCTGATAYWIELNVFQFLAIFIHFCILSIICFSWLALKNSFRTHCVMSMFYASSVQPLPIMRIACIVRDAPSCAACKLPGKYFCVLAAIREPTTGWRGDSQP